MIVLLEGENTHARHEAYEAIRATHDRDGALKTNTITLAGPKTSISELRAAALTVPFLADYRLVRVDGLGARFKGGRRRAAGEWDQLPTLLGEIPPTTVFVLIDNELPKNSVLRDAVEGAGGETRTFPKVNDRELVPWIQSRARALGVHLTPGAERLLAQLVGADLWALASELEKLRVYAGDDAVDETVVESLVPASLEGDIFKFVDAVAEGRSKRAFQMLEALRRDGAEPRRFITMLARQFRMIAVAREVLDGRGGEVEVQSALGVHPFVAKRATTQAQRFEQAAADAALARILAADEAIQNYWQGRPGGMNQDLAVEILVADLVGAG
jgi:DNA polymerase-3 subunit delta